MPLYNYIHECSFTLPREGLVVVSVFTLGAVFPFLNSNTLWNMGESLNLYIRQSSAILTGLELQ